MKTFYNVNPDEILKEFNSSALGLDDTQVSLNREKYGKNKLEEKEKKNLIEIFVEQFKDLLVIILILSALISAATGNMESTAVIIVVLILNAILGTVQTIKAQQSLESLKKLSSPSAKVVRQSDKQIIDVVDLTLVDDLGEYHLLIPCALVYAGHCEQNMLRTIRALPRKKKKQM